MSWMCSSRVKIQILKKIVKNLKSIVQNLYIVIVIVCIANKHISEIHLRFQGYVLVSSMVVFIITVECDLSYYTEHG
jgi:hypothetical protein